MNLSYAAICASLAVAHIDLNWADDQYFVTLLKLIREISKFGKKPEKQKVGASGMGKFIKE